MFVSVVICLCINSNSELHIKLLEGVSKLKAKSAAVKAALDNSPSVDGFKFGGNVDLLFFFFAPRKGGCFF